MKALRIILSQNQANYKKEEADLNKMSFPLPPFSSVIGALHVACGFKEYQPMDISIQGGFASLNREVYRDQAFLNSLQNDRGTLVKLSNSDFLSTSFIKVATAKKSQGNDFEKEITIEVQSREALNEYQNIREENRNLITYKKEILDPKVKKFKDAIKNLKEDQKQYDKKSDDYTEKAKEISEINLEKTTFENEYKLKKSEIDNAYAKFASLTTSIKSYEVLYDIELIIHIKSDEETLKTIQENVYNIRSIGRSEDFVDVKSCELVELNDEIDDENCPNSAYVKVENIKNEKIFVRGEHYQGTKYLINKNYQIQDNKRVFEKKWVVYTSNFNVESDNGEETGIYIDKDNYIVNFV